MHSCFYWLWCQAYWCLHYRVAGNGRLVGGLGSTSGGTSYLEGVEWAGEASPRV